MWLQLVPIILSTALITLILSCSAQTSHLHQQHHHHQQQQNFSVTTDDYQNDTNTCDLASCIRMITADDDDAPIRASTSSSDTLSPHNYLITSSIIYGVLMQAPNTELNHLCRSELITLQDSIVHKDIWAMKILDSSASSQPGFVWGNNFWMGSLVGCESVQAPKRITLSQRFPRNMKPDLLTAQAPFEVDYRMVYARHSSPWQVQVEFLLTEKILHIGLCLPSSCSNTEVMNLTQSYLDSNMLESQKIFDQQARVLHAKDLKLSPTFFEKTSIKIVGLFLIFTMCMLVMAAMYENERSRNGHDRHCKLASNNSSSIPEHRQYDAPSGFPMATGSQEDVNGNVLSIEKEPTYLQRIILCFSIRENWKYLVSTNSSPNAVPTINAFKAIGCFLIMNFHVNWYSYFTVHNPALVFALGEKFVWQWVSTTPIIVDIFFAISGMLLSYNFLRNEKKMDEIRANSWWKNMRLFGKQMLHRYIRLSPLYLVVIGFTEIASSYMVETSPFWIRERCDKMCQQHWWRNVLYIQNLFDVTELCLNWTWSMACEMQFFCIFTVLMFIYAKNVQLARKIFLTMFVAFTVLVFMIAVQTKFTPAYDVMHDLGTDLYISPWSRILPYLIGVGTGWLLRRCKGSISLNRKTINLLWTLATTIMLVCHLATVNRDISHYLAAPIIASVRVFYSGSACWMIVACATGHGGWFTSFMNMGIFVHLNKLSYAIYLLNPMVISVIFGLSDHSTHFDPITQVVTSFGIMVLVYLCAFVFSLLFEVPYTKVSVEILKGRKEKTR